MKKKYIIILSLFLCLNNLYAQRPNTKKISIPYILQPVNPLDDNIKYYSSSFVNNSTNYQASGLSPKLKGFQLLNEGEVDLNIRFVINSSSFTSIVEKVNYKEKINDSTYVNKVGGVFKVNAKINHSCYLTDKRTDKKLISNEGHIERKLFVSSRFSTVQAAIDARNSSAQSRGVSLINDMSRASVIAFERRLNNEYGFPLFYHSIPFARGRGRKHDYSDLEEAFNDFKTFTEIIKSAFEGENHPRFGNFTLEMNNEIIAKLNNCITIWKNAIEEYDSKKRKAKIGSKIIDNIYLNLSAAHFLHEDWKEVYETLSKVKIKKREIKTANNLLNLSKDIENRKLINQNKAMGKFGHISDLSKAMNLGEIINPNAQLNRQQAIAKLKEAKDLLELDMMSKEEFDALKSELYPIIRGN